MANTGIKETFTNLFKTTADKTKKILKKQAEATTSDITNKAKSVFDEGSSKTTSFLDIFKNKASQFSVPSATKSGKIKFKTPSAPIAKTNKGKAKPKIGLLIIGGVGAVVGIYFLTKPKKLRS